MDRRRLSQLYNRLNQLYARVLHKKSVSATDFLYRRVHPDQQKSRTEVSTAAFTDLELSVDLASLTSPEKTWARAKNPDWGLVRIPVALMRELSVPQEVRHWPEICNWAHTLVIGRKPGSVKNKLRENAEILIHVGRFRVLDPLSSASSAPPPDPREQF